PGAPSPRERLDLISALADAGFAPHVLVAPVVPHLTDSTPQLDDLLAALAAAGAARITAFPLHLRGATRDVFLDWLSATHPALLRHYRSLYGRGGYVRPEYSARLREKMAPLVARHGLARRAPEPASPPPPPPRDEPALTLF
ncbi:MAG: radical SAM protein, partial [Gordonia sp. (in: high G+C Gram-positive bacteria)]